MLRHHFAGKGSSPTAASSSNNYESSLLLVSVQPGQKLCTSPVNIYRTPGGQEYTNESVTGYIVAPGEHCDEVVVSRNKVGQLTYRYQPGYEYELNIIPTQPLVLDQSSRATAALFLTQDLAHNLAPGQVRYVDTAAVEKDSHGLHLLAGFPTAEKRFYRYYASVAVVDGRVQVCLPQGHNNQQGLHGGGDEHKDTFVRVTALHAGTDCRLPAVVKPRPQVHIASIPVGSKGFGECSDLVRGAEGQYFATDPLYWRDAGLPGYSRWPLHVMITHTTPKVFQVVVIDPESCSDFESNVVAIHKAA
jgi:hypothetical protein